jgi:membrane protein DedA with SNARE-associated domain
MRVRRDDHRFGLRPVASYWERATGRVLSADMAYAPGVGVPPYDAEPNLVVASPARPEDEVPSVLRRLQARWVEELPASGRTRVALVLSVVGVAVATIVIGARLLRILLDAADLLAYLGLFVVNWVANGGLLVPIPGLRLVGWLLIIGQGGTLDPAIAGVVGGIAMACGQTSYYIAGDTGRRHAAAHVDDPSGTPKHPRLAGLSNGPRIVRAKRRIAELLGHHGVATIALLSLVPNPLTPFACGTAGAIGMGFRRFVLASLLGRIALGLFLAYLGESIVQWIDPHRHF